MIKSIKYYLSLYRLFISNSLSMALSFRTTFILLIFMDIFFYFSVIYSSDFLFDHLDRIGPWNKDQFLFFLSFMITMDCIHMGIFSSNFWNLGFKIKTGELDFDLLKPSHSIFNCFFRELKPSSLISSPVALYFLISNGQKAGLLFTDWLILPFLILLGLSLLCVLEFILSTSMFWVLEGIGINFLRMQFQTLSRWPDFIYQFSLQKAFTFLIPLLLIGSAPVHFLLDKSKWPLLVYMVISIIVFSFILIKLWNYALSKYDSASS